MASLLCNTNPLCHTRNKAGTCLEIALWASSVKRLSGLLFRKRDHHSLSQLIRSFAESRWFDASLFSAFSFSCRSKVQELLRFFFVCLFFYFRYVLKTDRTPGEPVLHAHSKLSQLLIMAFTRNWEKNNLNLVQAADATPCRPDLCPGRETETCKQEVQFEQQERD